MMSSGLIILTFNTMIGSKRESFKYEFPKDVQFFRARDEIAKHLKLTPEDVIISLPGSPALSESEMQLKIEEITNRYKQTQFILINRASSPMPDAFKEKLALLEKENKIDESLELIQSFLDKFPTSLDIDYLKNALESLQKKKKNNQKELFKKAILRSKNLKFSQLSQLLHIPESDLLEWLLDLPEEYGFTIDQDVIEFNKSSVEDHIDELLRSFENNKKLIT